MVVVTEAPQTTETEAPQTTEADQSGYPTETEAAGIFVGAPVSIKGLETKWEYNGAKGTVSAGPFDNGRWEVSIPKDEKYDAKVLSLKPANFQLDVEALQEYVMQKRAANKPKRNPPLESSELVWLKGKGLSAKGLTSRTVEVPQLDHNHVLFRIDKFAFSHMALGYLMKGYTRSFKSYHDFFKVEEEGQYRSAMWGIATVVESMHPKVPVGTRVFGLVPPSQYYHQKIMRYIPESKQGDPAVVELDIEGMDYKLRRFQEMEVIKETQEDQELESWLISCKELYTMAFYMDEQLLTETGQINSVIISCASSKTALCLAYLLRDRGKVMIDGKLSPIERVMSSIVGLTSKEHLEFVKSTGLYHEVLTYEDVDNIATDKTVVYMDFKCDGALRQAITLKLGPNLMYNMVLGPAVFQKRMKDQIFEKRAREVLFDESTWRERRRLVAEVTKTGRNEKLKNTFKEFVEYMRQHIKLKHICDTEGLRNMYDTVYNNNASPSEAYVCSLHPNEFAVEQIWTD